MSLITAGNLRFSHGISSRAIGWRWLNAALWISLAITNGVKISEELKEGIRERKATKYPMVDQVTDVYVSLAVF